MKKITNKFKMLVVLLITFTYNISKAQSFVVTVNSGINSVCSSGGTSTVSAVVSSLQAGATSYSWSINSFACNPATYTLSSLTGTQINIAFSCVGTYSIFTYAMNSSSVIQIYAQMFSVGSGPNLTVTPNQTICTGGSANIIANGAITYTWITGALGSSIAVTPTVSTCYIVIGSNSLGCISSATSCVTLTNAPLPVSPSSQTVCQGSSATFTASGASSYNWSAGSSTTSILNIIPTGNTSYSVFGTFSTNCMGTASVSVVVDTTCSNVWPGDANSDGVVNTSDVFEIGLAFNNTGAARSPGGNSYISQFANIWSGTVSTGKNKCHADCNGDGTVNNSDTVAIHTNFLLTHSFKPAESAVNGDISFSANSTIVNEGMWSKVDILLGSSASPVNQVYGVAFDVNFDQSLIETNSAYVVYTSSFLNASNQNVQFRKADFSNGKIYAASVRVNGSNVSGNGKIGEFWFKAKTGLPANSVLNISASNASRINNSKVNAPLSGGSTSLTVVKNAVGINETNLERAIQLFPNPASNVITLQSTENSKISYNIFDIVGREVLRGEFLNSKTINVSSFAKGAYFIRFVSDRLQVTKKLVID
jgi:hypothetical protein